jgi:uncharacterized membrane protein
MKDRTMKKSENEWYVLVAYVVVVLLVTRFFVFPLGAGYFNFGDVFVVFSGLMLGKKGGAIAGGVGAAVADVILGYALFAPLTLLAKGAEGFICGIAKGKKGILTWIIPAAGALMMVTIYFVGECFMPSIKLQGAVGEALPNLIQACGGFVGGRLLFEIYTRASCVK